MIKLAIIVLLLLLSTPTSGATYYVSNAGNNANNGTTTGTSWAYAPGMAGCTSVCASTTLVPGDTVLLNKGDTWRDGVTVPASGSAGSVITYGSYGTGVLPIINGANVLSSGWAVDVSTGANLTADANLQAYYYLEEASGTRADGTANANTLTDTGGTTRSSDHKQGSFSASFASASSQELSRLDANLSAGFVGKSGTTNTAITFGGWFQLSAIGIAQGLMSKGSSSTAAYSMYVNSAGIVHVVMVLDGVEQNMSSSVVVTAGAWVHVIGRLTLSTKKFEMFINGALQSDNRTLTSTTINTNTNVLRIGNVSSIGPLNGLADEVIVFNRALSDSEIVDLYGHGLDGTRTLINVWNRTLTTNPNGVWFNGVRGTRVANLPNVVVGVNRWWWSGNVLAVYSTSDPASAFTTPGVEGSIRDTMTIACSYVTITGLDLTHAHHSGVLISGEFLGPTIGTRTHNTITLSSLHDNGIEGINMGTNLNNGETVDNTVISDNLIHHNGHSGVRTKDYTTFTTITRNAIHHNCQVDDGILDSGDVFFGGVYAAQRHTNDTTMEYNDVYQNGIKDDGTAVSGSVVAMVGLWCDSQGANCVTRYNRVHDNYGYQIHYENMVGGLIIGNLVYRTAGAPMGAFARGIAIKASGDPGEQSNKVYNNTVNGMPIGIVVDCVDVTPGLCKLNEIKNNIVTGSTTRSLSALRGGENDGVNGSGNIYDHNDFGPAFANFIEWGSGVFKSTYAAWETAYGGTTNSVQVDPLFTNVGAGNFTLQAGSPAINAGADLGGAYRTALVPSASWPANVALSNQNSYGAGWEMGAFVFNSGAPLNTRGTAGARGRVILR